MFETSKPKLGARITPIFRVEGGTAFGNAGRVDAPALDQIPGKDTLSLDGKLLERLLIRGGNRHRRWTGIGFGRFPVPGIAP